MRGRPYGVVTMRAKVARMFSAIAADKVPFDPRDTEVVSLFHLRPDAPAYSCLKVLHQTAVRNHVVSPALPAVIIALDGLAPDFLHETALPTPMMLEQSNEMPAQLGFEDVRQHKNGRTYLAAQEIPGQRK